MTAAAPPDAAQTLAAWQAREAEVRGRVRAFDVSPPQRWAGRTGLENFQALLSGELPAAPISQTLNFILVEAEFGRVQFQGRPLFEHYNPMGGVHGGWIATLLDSAVACAIHSTLPANKSYTTLELKVNYVRGLNDKVPLVRAIGQVVHSGGRIGTSEGRLVGPDGTLYAHATTTCLVFDPR